MVVLDATIANIAMPYIGNDLDFSRRQPDLDRHRLHPRLRRPAAARRPARRPLGRRRVFMIGVIIFGVASLLGGLAQTEELLLGARVPCRASAPRSPPRPRWP